MPDYRVLPGPDHIHPFANAIASDDLIFITGLASPGGTVAEQVRGCFEQIEALLRDVDSSMSEVIYIRPAVTDRSLIAEMDAALREVLPSPAPAAGSLLVAQLADESLMVEFEVMAQRGARLVAPQMS